MGVGQLNKDDSKPMLQIWLVHRTGTLPRMKNIAAITDY